MDSSKKAYHLILVHSGRSGFFSLFNKILGYLEHYKPVYAITWHVYEPFKAYGEGEMFSKVFLPYVNLEYKDYQIEEVLCYHHYDGKLTGQDASRLYTKEGCISANISLNWRDEFNGIFKTFFQMHNQRILNEYYRFLQVIQNYRNQGKKIITFLIRHPILRDEQENKIMPSFSMYDDEIMKVSNGDLSKVALVCLTDSQEAHHYFLEKYKEYEIVFPEVEKRWEYEIDSVCNPGGDEKIDQAVLSVLYLTAGDHFIHPVSNMATAVLILNPQIQHSYLIGR